MGYRALLEANPETVQDLELSARRRLDGATALYVAEHHHTAIYVAGLSAEVSQMKTKSIRMPDELLRAVKLVEQTERIEEAVAIRKLLRAGLEWYLANMYRRGEITLREAAERLDRSQSDTIDLFLRAGIRGNLDASDVLTSIDAFID